LRVSATPLIHGRNAVLEAARAGRVVKVYQAVGLGHDPRLDELARLAQVEVVPAERLDVIAPGVPQGVAAELKPRKDWAPLSPAAVKASSGASELLRICRVSGLPSAIAEVKRSGIWCVALDPRGEMNAWEFDFTQRVCIVVGSEGEGVHRLVKERCDARVRLPVKGHIASLNAAAAAAALLYEVTRQRTVGRS